MYFYQQLAQELRRHGARALFGLMGDANLFMVDAFVREQAGRFYSVNHENSGVLAALGYAEVTGEVGFATVTHGPALSNTATALIEAARSRSAIVLIAGDTPAGQKFHLQDLPQREFVAATGAEFVPSRSPETLVEDFSEAVHLARLKRMPVVFNVPADFQWCEVTQEQTSEGSIEHGDPVPGPDPTTVEEVASALFVAKRPLLVAGRGAVTPQARAAILSLSERLGAPVATTLRARGLFSGEPANLGVFGAVANENSLESMLSADAVVFFGASLNKYTTAEESLVKGRTIVHVDRDPESLGRYYRPTIGVVADSELAADAIVDLLDVADAQPTSFRESVINERFKEASRPRAAKANASHVGIDIRVALERLNDVLPKDRVVVTDVGRFMRHAFETVDVCEARSFVPTVAFGSIGLGTATAIGAGVGRPDRPVVLIAGDGGFSLGGINEFMAAVRSGIDLVTVVLNDGAYGAEHIQFTARGLDPSLSTFDWPDFGPIATAMGGEGYTVRTLDELDAAFGKIATRSKPLLIDVRLDPTQISSKRR